MYYAADKQKAQRAIAELRAVRASERAHALACLRQLRNEVATERGDGPHLEAWEAIRTLYEALGNGHLEDLELLWDDAILKAEIWHASLR
jgi:hypothetical protein